MSKVYPPKNEYLRLAEQYNNIPVYLEMPGDLYTAISLFLKIKKGRYQFLLESAVSGKHLGRYSFMGNSEQAIACKNYNITHLNQGEVTKNIKCEDPLDYLRKFSEKIVPYKNKNLPPFVGGLVGYFGYDSIQYFEKINLIDRDDLNLKDFEMIVVDKIIVYDNLTHKLFIIFSPIIYNPSQAAKIYDQTKLELEKMTEEISREININLPFNIPKENGRIIYKSNFSKENFKKAVEKTKHHIYEGDIFQLVLSQRLKVPIEGEAFNLYRSLRQINPSPYMFYLKFDEVEIIGSSPEIHVQLSDKKLTVRPIAGTRPRGTTFEEDKINERSLLADEKELAEHLMLVDLGRNDLGRVSRGGTVKLDVFKTVEYYSHVMHIVSNVTGELDSNYDLFDLIKATFPAGTVSGAPKIRAMEIISELEPSRRGIYSGLIGYLTFDQNLDSCIAIRTFVIKDGMAYLQAGAGIVADSVPENEYQETLHKLKVLTRALEQSGEGQ